MSRNKIMGYTQLKNNPKRNAFDLSHRHMFTSQIGELLPIACYWANPNETFKIGYNGLTRTDSLQTAAFTRLRENIQYYFVPFQSLWRYFEQQYNNMKKGDAGQNISQIAKSSTEESVITTKLPYVSYTSIAQWLNLFITDAINALVSFYQKTSSNKDYRTAPYFYDFCVGRTLPNGVVNTAFVNKVFRGGSYRLCRACKLLMALGYGNFSVAAQYDIFAMAQEYMKEHDYVWNPDDFLSSEYSLKFSVSDILQAPNLSIFPLLAYHKICQDHYKLRQWQPFEPYCCNIDYLSPTDDMNAYSFLGSRHFSSSDMSIIDMEQSNLPVDYLLGVLPRAQYGDESVVSIGLDATDVTIKTSDPLDSTKGFLFDSGNFKTNDNIQKPNTPPTSYDGKYVSTPVSYVTGSKLVGLHGELSATSSGLKISALRAAYALQRYKEVQNSNDSDFASQVLAIYGIKPKTDNRKSVFIGGSDKTITINPQVNQNLVGDNQTEIKAIGVSDLSAGCKFTATTPGLIIGIYRCTPQLDYSHTGIDRNLLKTDAVDFPNPMLDNIGMQTQYRFEVDAPQIGTNSLFDSSAKGTFGNSINMSVTYGYAPMFAELKTSFDRFEGGFLGTFSTWVTGLSQKFLQQWIQSNSASPNNELYNGIDSLLECSPELCYPIFMNQWSGTVNDDKLLVGSVNTCKAIRPYHVYGLPWTK